MSRCANLGTGVKLYFRFSFPLQFLSCWTLVTGSIGGVFGWGVGLPVFPICFCLDKVFTSSWPPVCSTSTCDLDYLGSKPPLDRWSAPGNSWKLGERRECEPGKTLRFGFCILNSFLLWFHLPALASRLLPSVTWNSYAGLSSRNFERESVRRVKSGYGFYHINCF